MILFFIIIMDSKQIYSDLVVLQDLSHTYHIRTVNLFRCKTLHSALWEVYTTIQEIIDAFGENIIQKLEKDIVPSPCECYENTQIIENNETDRQKMLFEIYKNIEEQEELFHDLVDESNNTIAQIIWPFWEKFTNLKALLEREMYSLPKEEKE